MADDKRHSSSKSAAVDSATKTEDEATQEGKPGANVPVALNHGEISDSRQDELDAAKDVAKDPFGTTPLQQRDSHSPEVDPEQNDPTRGGIDTGGRSQRLDPMRPSDESASPDQPVKGGTTAPA